MGDLALATGGGSTRALANPPAPPVLPRQLTPVDHEIIVQMIAMGFSAELAQEAVQNSPPDSLEQAVDYCERQLVLNILNSL